MQDKHARTIWTELNSELEGDHLQGESSVPLVTSQGVAGVKRRSYSRNQIVNICFFPTQQSNKTSVSALHCPLAATSTREKPAGCCSALKGHNGEEEKGEEDNKCHLSMFYYQTFFSPSSDTLRRVLKKNKKNNNGVDMLVVDGEGWGQGSRVQ